MRHVYAQLSDCGSHAVRLKDFAVNCAGTESRVTRKSFAWQQLDLRVDGITLCRIHDTQGEITGLNIRDRVLTLGIRVEDLESINRYADSGSRHRRRRSLLDEVDSALQRTRALDHDVDTAGRLVELYLRLRGTDALRDWIESGDVQITCGKIQQRVISQAIGLDCTPSSAHLNIRQWCAHVIRDSTSDSTG